MACAQLSAAGSTLKKHAKVAPLVALLIQPPQCRQAPRLRRQQQEAAARGPLHDAVQRPPMAATGTRSMATSTQWAAGALLPVLQVPGTGSRCSRALHGSHQRTWPAAPAARGATTAAAAVAPAPATHLRQRQQQAGWPAQLEARLCADSYDSTRGGLLRWLTSRGQRPQQRVMARLVMAAASVVRYF